MKYLRYLFLLLFIYNVNASVSLTWTPVIRRTDNSLIETNVDIFYRVQRSEFKNLTSNIIIGTVKNNTNFIDNPIPGKTYYYFITSYIVPQIVSARSNSKQFIIPPSNKYIYLSWLMVNEYENNEPIGSNVMNYELWKYSNLNTNNILIATNTLNFSDTNIIPGQTYYYYVKNYIISNNKSETSNIIQINY
jgi:hypothetical protein